MTLLDRWLAMRFLRAYLTFLGSGALVFVTIDLFTQLESLERRGLAAAAFQRYATVLPELFLTLSPFLAVLAALWVVAALRRQNELIPLLAAGVSPRRVAAPVLAMGIVLAPLVWADRELLLPELADLRRQQGVLRQRAEAPRPIPDDRSVLAPRLYVPSSGELLDVRYTLLDEQDREVLTVLAAQGREVRKQGWLLEQGVTIRRDRSGAVPRDDIAFIPSGGYLLESSVQREDVEAAVEAPSYLSRSQLKRQLQRTPSFKHLEVQLYERVTYPLASFVLLLLALPIALGGESAVDAFLRMLVCGAVAFLYFVTSHICVQLGAREILPAAVGALGPLVVFGGAGAWLMLRAR